MTSDEERTSLRRYPVRALLLLPVLTAYTAVLLLASIPETLRFGVLEAPQARAAAFFHAIHARAGSFVFAGPSAKWVRNRLCFAVIGVTEDERQVILYESVPACRHPKLRLRENIFDTAIIRSSHFWSQLRVATDTPESARYQRSLKRLRSAPNLDELSAWFCQSNFAPEADVQKIWIAFMTTAVHYRSGKRRNGVHVIHGWQCQDKGRRIKRGHPFGRLGAGGVRLDIDE